MNKKLKEMTRKRILSSVRHGKMSVSQASERLGINRKMILKRIGEENKNADNNTR
jgi:predicted ArsR family transcriptional regulator